ncbi:hypothetical protein [Obesumbacterium proteus]|uniref:Uncharacterized protein n=1 Tax=Obesumbacterium proteus ATCC 12841 TaxID=1354268 RepID=A0AA91EG33_9GAMM|nr:hypothetical protein [Obesumbacterium proteus]AMO80667.1 hypothetical protein DSM2777_06160 [Obesumbacterium proteus]OAT60165.1 hypothetical protein M993_00941 [Obesumbacterium proteus ATCC 12841]
MRKSTVISAAIIVGLIVFATLYFSQLGKSTAPNVTIAAVQPIGNDLYLYVTQTNNGGATVPMAYRYYIGEEIDPRSIDIQLNHEEPFIVSNSERFTWGYASGEVTVNVTGRLYDFKSSASYLKKGIRNHMPVRVLNTPH